MGKRRTYEISLWTLQDSFIAVLGDSSSQTQGYIEDPIVKLSNDGTQELDFSLPMYIDNGITRTKSIIWDQMTDAITIAGMRKIKVIFNRGEPEEAIYEFIITQVTDTHEQNMPRCEVHCEGLAFHELGKIGYKYSLSIDDYYADEEAIWEKFASGTVEEQLARGHSPNIDYWCEKIGLKKYSSTETPLSSVWYYRVNMDWSGFFQSASRKANKVYEEAYIATYDEDLNPTEYVNFQEKYRFVTASGSNIYNLTQEIAKTFGVYCKYEYKHDTNYHITQRIVTFYNNFIDETNRLEFTYPYTTAHVIRENDSTDLITKMYVNAIENAESETGVVTIMDNPINPTKEDYLLNFDYLYAINTISDEQYKYIKTFSQQVKALNEQILKYQTSLIKKDTIETTYSAQLTVFQNALEEDNKQIETYNQYINGLTGNTGKITRSGNTRLELNVSSRKITFTEAGILPNTIKLYENFTTSTTIKADKININSSGYATSATLPSSFTGARVVVGYSYVPNLYYTNVLNLYTKRKAKDNAKVQQLQNRITALNDDQETISVNLEDVLEQKADLLKEFERVMGPALREGNWTPEDYTNVAHANYQFIEKMTTSFNPKVDNPVIKKATSGPPAELLWDSNPLYNETQISYQDIGGVKRYYCIMALNSSLLSHITTFYASKANAGKNLSLVFWDSNFKYNKETNERPNPLVKSYTLGTDCEFIFYAYTNESNKIEIKPGLLLTWLSNDDKTLIGDLQLKTSANSSNIKMYLCTIGINSSQQLILQNSTEALAPGGCIIFDNLDKYYKIYQLRYRIKDYTLLVDEQNLKISYGKTALAEFDDYNVAQIVNTASEAPDYGYNITFKPETLIKKWNTANKLQVNYSCSQLSTAIYLDAVQILKENAYPKVTYSIDPNIMYEDFFYTDYNALNKIAFINDNELAFDQVQGYISDITLNLQKPWEDTIEVKNYKNKFEDIFSSIVASTETMAKSEAFISSVGNVVNINGNLSAAQIQSALSSTTLKYTLSDGTIVIGKTQGIVGSNGENAISLKPTGIQYATNTDDETGQWVWADALTPSGINADAIQYGTLNLSAINLAGALTTNAFNLTTDQLTVSSSSGIVSKNMETLNDTTVLQGDIKINNGILTSSSYNSDIETLGVSLSNGRLSISTAANLYIDNTSISDYISNNSNTVILGWWNNIVDDSNKIPISSISVGKGNNDDPIYITNNSIRLGTASNPILNYNYENNITTLTLKLGNILNYTASETTLAGWSAAADGLFAYDENQNIISQISPDTFNFNNKVNIDANGVQIKDIQLISTTNNEHIITFINDETNYQLKINAEGLYYSLDGSTWQHVLTEPVSEEPIEPDPEPEP